MPGIQSPQSFLDLTGVNNLAANSVAQFEMPTGAHEIEAVQIAIGSVTKALMTTSYVKLDGKIIWDFASVTDLELIMAYYKYVIDPLFVTFPFVGFHYEDRDQELITALGLADIRKATIEIQLGAATLTTPPTAQYLRSRNVGDARYRPAIKGNASGIFQPNQSGLVRAFKRYNRTISAAGIATIQDVPRNGMLQALHIVHDGNTSAAELRFGGLTSYKGTGPSLKGLANYPGYRTTQANVITLDFGLGNSPYGAIILDGQTPDLIVTTTAASTIRLYWELSVQASEL